MAPQDPKIYILHDLCVVSMVSVFSMSKTADLEIEGKNVIKRI